MRWLSLCLSLLAFASPLWPQGFLWEKKGILGGNIHDLMHDIHRGRFILASDSGLFVSEDTLNWMPDNTGLFDLSVSKLAWMPLDGTRSLYVVLAWDGVYAKASDWVGWRYADETGLDDPVGGMTYSYADVRTVGLYHNGTTWQVAVAVSGAGIAFRSFDPATPADPWGTSWTFDTTYSDPAQHNGNPFITALLGANNRLYAATYGTQVGLPAEIHYKLGSAWTKAFDLTGTDFLSLGGDPSGNAADILAGTMFDGVYHAPNGASGWNRFCNAMPGGDMDYSSEGPWWDLAVIKEGAVTRYFGTTGMNLFKLDASNCADPYRPYSHFPHYAETVAPESGDALLAGTFGMGLWHFPAPDQPGSPRGHTGSNALQMRNVSDIDIALSASRPDTPPVIFTASETEGLYKCFSLNYCTRYFFAPLPDQPGGVSGRSVALVPGYDEYGEVRYNAGNTDTIVGLKTLYLGTGRNGLFRSDNGGASWKKLINTPANPFTGGELEIVKVAVAPDFDAATTLTADKHLFALAREGTVLWSVDGGETWVVDRPVDYSGSGNTSAVANDLVISPAYNRTDPFRQRVFLATSGGVHRREWDGEKYNWVPLSAFSQPVLSLALSPCFGLAFCPNCVDPGCDLERNTLLAGTKNGLFVSTDSGSTFLQVLDPSCPGPGASITTVALHPKSDTGNVQNRLLAYGVKHSFDTTGSDQPLLFRFRRSYEGEPHWECANADPSDPPLAGFSDYMIRALAFSPAFGSGGNAEVFAGHEYAAMWRAQHPPTGTPAWQRLDGFYNTPERVNSIAECPLSYRPQPVVLAGTENYGVMISFDGGESYFPWGYGFEAVYGGKLRTLHNAEAVACTDLYFPTPEPIAYHRILAAGNDCAAFDGTGVCTTHFHAGILWGDFEDPFHQTRWNRSLWTDGGAPGLMDGHPVTELRWCPWSDPNNPLPVYAADPGVGPLFSNPPPDPFEDPPPPDDGHHWGEVWHLDASGEYPTDLTDVTCPAEETGPMMRAEGPGSRDARGSFIWGAQSGLTPGRATGTAKFKASPFDNWQTCTGLPPTANWRSILMLGSQTILIGDQGGDLVLSSGIYRNTQEGSTCTLWSEAGTGLEAGDTPGVTADYSKKIIAFAEVANGVLAAMEEGGPGSLEGGVFFSDAASDGAAWVPVNSGMSCTSNYEVVNGQFIYTGSTCDGVYATTEITYDGHPAAKFTYALSTDPWTENRVLFTDLSAGLPTARAWDFDGDGNDDATPSGRTVAHDYWLSGSATFDPRLTSFNGPQSDTYRLSDDGLGPIAVTNTHIPRVEREMVETEEYITVYWNRISGSGHIYHVWASPDADGSGRTEVAAVADGTQGSGTGYTYDCTADPCWLRYKDESAFDDLFYKLQTTW